MTTSYPIVAQHELGDPVKRRLMGLWKGRENDEIPKIKPHEVLVYRVGDRFVVDERRLGAYDDTVVSASSVSVVSVQRGTEVPVSFRIDSMDASAFMVRVTFVCSVVDPVIVVRDGQVDAADALLAYLRGYQDLFQLGLKHPISEINDVRTEAALHVRAYMARRPPEIPGMKITEANVQVETPTVLADLGQLANQQLIELQKVRAEAQLEDRRQTHMLAKTAKLGDALGDDPRRALDLAHAEGGLSSQEYAEKLQQLADVRHQRGLADRQAATARQHEIEDRDAHWNRDDRQWMRETRRAEVEWQRGQLELERQETSQLRRTEWDAKLRRLDRLDSVDDRTAQWAREDRQLEAQWAREDRHTETEWQRTQIEVERGEARQRRRDQIEADIKLLQLFAERGHLDTHYEDLGDLIKRIRGAVGADPGRTVGDQAALTQGERSQPDAPKDDDHDR